MNKELLKNLRKECSNFRLLYVEDHDELRESMGRIFENIFESVEFGIDGADGFEKYKKSLDENKPYDLVISDIEMPTMNGLEMCSKIREELSEQKFIFLTAYGDSNYLLKGIELGVDGFLIKPLKTEQMHDTLTKVCKSLSAQRAIETYIASIEALNQSLMEKNQQEKFNNMKDDLLRNLSHEIRTPLHAIQSSVQLLTKKLKDNPKASSISSLAIEGVERITKLTDRMIQLSELQSNSYKITNKSSILQDSITKLITNFETEAKNKGVQISFDIDQILTNTIKCDAKTVESIVHELVDNAIKFTPTGGNVELSILSNVLNNTLSIRVKDNGIGMSSEEKEHCFDLFYQADASISRQAEGSGIGLSIVEHMVELLKGKVLINSSKETGTMVKVDISFEIPASVEAA